MAVRADWSDRNNALQADMPIDYFAPGVTPPAGLRNVLNWYWRANASDDWTGPTTHIVYPPATSDTFDEPGDGFVRLVSFTQLGDLTCLQPTQWEGYVVAGDPYTPGNRITDAGDNRITDAVNDRTTE